MALFILNVILIFLTNMCNGQKADYCTDEFLYKDIPEGIAWETFHIITTGTIENVVGCKPVAVDKNSIKFLLYNRQNLETPISLKSYSINKLDSTKPIIFQIPGWFCGFSNARMPEMKNAYLSRYDANVIVVDWSRHSIDLYSKSVCYVPPIGKVLGKFICHITKELNVDLSTIHLVGHSLGAHLAGFAGKEVQKQCGKTIGRITGLDPAGPLYQYLPTDRKLDKTDAMHVDVIHSNMGYAGYFGSCGSADFYPNCGVIQPGCSTFQNVSDIEEILNLPFAVVFCNHVRSLQFMIESIASTNGTKFISKKCDLVPALPIIGLCGNLVITNDKTEMGENCSPDPPGRKFCLKTNEKPPYAQG